MRACGTGPFYQSPMANDSLPDHYELESGYLHRVIVHGKSGPYLVVE